MSEWRPIETAPTDGTAVLLLFLNRSDLIEECISAGYLFCGEELEALRADALSDGEIEYAEQMQPYWRGPEWDDEPTHWMPIPALPV